MSVDTHVDKAADDLVITTTAEGAQEVASSMKASVTLAPRPANITKDAEGTSGVNVIRFTVQAKDARGIDLAKRIQAIVWISDVDFGAPQAQVDFSTVTGTRITILQADAAHMILTDAAGQATIDVEVAGAATKFFMCALGGETKSLSATWAA